MSQRSASTECSTRVWILLRCFILRGMLVGARCCARTATRCWYLVPPLSQWHSVRSSTAQHSIFERQCVTLKRNCTERPCVVQFQEFPTQPPQQQVPAPPPASPPRRPQQPRLHTVPPPSSHCNHTTRTPTWRQRHEPPPGIAQLAHSIGGGVGFPRWGSGKGWCVLLVPGRAEGVA